MTAEEVKALLVGSTVYMVGEDPEGKERSVKCIVAFRGSPANKFLTYRDNGQIRKCAIKDYPGKRYEGARWTEEWASSVQAQPLPPSPRSKRKGGKSRERA